MACQDSGQYYMVQSSGNLARTGISFGKSNARIEFVSTGVIFRSSRPVCVTLQCY